MFGSGILNEYDEEIITAPNSNNIGFQLKLIVLYIIFKPKAYTHYIYHTIYTVRNIFRCTIYRLTIYTVCWYHYIYHYIYRLHYSYYIHD